MGVVIQKTVGTQLEIGPSIVGYNGTGNWDDDVLFFFDATNPKSYPGSGTTWTDLTSNGRNGTLSGATFSTDHINFDGSNDKLTFSSNISIPVHNGFTFWVVWDLPTQTGGAWNYFLYHNPSGNHKYEFGQYGTNADTFHYKDNISYAGTAMTTALGSGYATYAFGANSDGHSYTSVNGAPATVKDPGSNSYWATSPTTNMVFSELFRGGGTNLGAKVKMMILYNRGLTDAELYQNNRVSKSRR